ncbi:MAG: sarcosine oxidase subunit alpha family protein [Geminicoccaceae bacterium]
MSMSMPAAPGDTVLARNRAAAASSGAAAPVQPGRLARGGLIDRTAPLSFTFDGKACTGFAGDSLASALLANGITLVGRSFKYHRPRGLLSAGPEEPNALVTLGAGARREPNTRATMVELFDGLQAVSQNRWPSLELDIMALNGLASPLLGAGFYYKTFHELGLRGWVAFEHLIRRAAGLGIAARTADPDSYDKAYGFCDVLVVGGGLAGLAAAREAARAGARVWLVDERPRFGGMAHAHDDRIGHPADDSEVTDERGWAPPPGTSARHWVDDVCAELAANGKVRLMPRASVFGLYDHGVAGIVERVTDHLGPSAPAALPRQRFWTVRARQIVLATGAFERPQLFAGNDRPGVMLANAARTYASAFAVGFAQRTVVSGNNQSIYAAALALHERGVSVDALVDCRQTVDDRLTRALRQAGIRHFPGHVVQAALGGRHLEGVVIAPIDGGKAHTLACDGLAMGQGWTPAVHLHSMRGSKPVWHAALHTYLPGGSLAGIHCAGALEGAYRPMQTLRSGVRAAAAACAALDLPVTVTLARDIVLGDGEIGAVLPPQATKKSAGKAFVDFQNDVTAADVQLAVREGYDSVELPKRYTTLGMATDQGKTANVIGIALMGEALGRPPAEIGTSTFRPPYAPVTLGAFAGSARDAHFKPVRRTALHDWHASHGAVFTEAGLWLRPHYYTSNGATLDEAYVKEAAHVRRAVGLVDVSTLGKIDIQGPDAAELLNRVYVNGWSKLPPGRARYGLMLREDGFVLDDGTTSRLSEHHYFMTTTTAHAAQILQHLEYYTQVVWPDLRVQLTSATEQWAQMALAGPQARTVLAAAVDDLDVGNAALPFMGVALGHIDGAPVRLYRISFSGELAYEIGTPAGYGPHVWQRLIDCGAGQDIMPYGVEAMGALRIEKGHIAGGEIDGRTTLDDLGMAGLASSKKDFIGKAMMHRPALIDPDRPKLVGLIAEQPERPVRAGAHLVAGADRHDPGDKQGWVSSWTYSPALHAHLALAFLKRGSARHGERLFATSPLTGEHERVRVVAPCMVDPQGERLRG